MKSLSKALIIIVCLVCACWLVLEGREDAGAVILIFASMIALLYELKP